jgi:enolase
MTSIEVEIATDEGTVGRASAPFGAPGSKSDFEPPGYPPGGINEAMKFLVDKAIPQLSGMSVMDQERFDMKLHDIDGTPRFARMGANTSTVLSIACAKAAAATVGLPLYRYLGGTEQGVNSWPILNTIGGGPHARKGVSPDMQEHHLIPVGAKTFAEAVFASRDAWLMAGEICRKRFPMFTGGQDDESAWVPPTGDWEALEVLDEVCQAFTDNGIQMRIGVDVAGDNLYHKSKGVYVYDQERVTRTPDEQFDYMCRIVESFPVYYLEDMFHGEDFENFARFTERYGQKMLVCADDLTICNQDRLRTAIEKKACNSFIVKVNMNGTLTDTSRAVQLGHEHNLVPVKSARSGETEDAAIAHLAVVWGCPLSKFRLAGIGCCKINEQLRIEENLVRGPRKPAFPYL